jgi:hypothetical protein
VHDEPINSGDTGDTMFISDPLYVEPVVISQLDGWIKSVLLLFVLVVSAADAVDAVAMATAARPASVTIGTVTPRYRRASLNPRKP